jgi:hypothetical protein
MSMTTTSVESKVWMDAPRVLVTQPAQVAVSWGLRRRSRWRSASVRTHQGHAAGVAVMESSGGAVSLLVQVAGLIALALFLGVALVGGAALVLQWGAGA